MNKNNLRTIRFTDDEAKKIGAYLKQNPSFESLSSLGRVAIMEFIFKQPQLQLSPLHKPAVSDKRDFLWDYDLTDTQIRSELARKSPGKRRWMAGLLLERLSVPQIFEYMTVDEISEILPHVRIRPKIKRHWQKAVRIWQSAK